MVQYRDHRRELAESMQAVQTFATKAELLDYLEHDLGRFGFAIEELTITPYACDKRIGWLDTHIVTIKDYGVAGFTDGPLP
jgi:hypothetical protein